MITTDLLKEKIDSIKNDIELVVQYWNNSNNEQTFQDLDTQATHEHFWQNPDQAKISQKLQGLRSIRNEYLEVTNSYKEIKELIEMFSDNDPELEQIYQDINLLIKKTKDFKITLFMGEEYDASDCFMEINSGAGGTESQDWANMLLRMFLRFCEKNKLKTAILEIHSGEEAGIKSATLHIKGKNAYGLMKNEHGVHRLVRISPFDSNKRRHTSFAAITVIPELPPAEKIEIDPKDLRIDTYRSSGAGGQHVNKTDSAVRITHLPTNIVVQCQDERSQTQNKETAMKVLMTKLKRKQDEEEKNKVKTDKQKNEWGSQIRSYVLHPYKMVKDHRTGVEHMQPDLVLDGDLITFIEANLLQKNQ
jgi:peptide chain release factor 2